MSLSISTRALCAGIAAGLICGLAPNLTGAQDYPAKLVRVITPGAPGSLADLLARQVFARVSESFGQQFVIDNRTGAGGSLAAELAARAPADGYTLFPTVNTVMVVNPFLYSKLGYDPQRDFDPVTMLTKISEVLVVHPSVGVKSVPDLVRLAKARPGQITYSSAGNGHPTHLMMELLQRKAEIKLLHVPYKSTTAGMQALVSGEVGIYNIGIGLARPHIVSGKVLALAKTGHPAADALPDVAALTTFYRDAEYVPWTALFVPKGTPKDIVMKLNAAVRKVLDSAELKTRTAELYLTAAPSTPEALDKALRADAALNRELIKSIGLKLD
jgi:tripartite-type tricarboxylate transporter receptor subunit TctC